MEESTNEKKNRMIQIKWKIWMIVSIIGMVTSVFYIFNIIAIFINMVIFMITIFRRLAYQMDGKIELGEDEKIVFTYSKISKSSFLLLLFEFAATGLGYICDATFFSFLIISVVFTFLIVLPTMLSFEKRLSEIEEYDYKQIDKIFYRYLIIAVLSIVCIFFLRTYLDTKAHSIVATE